MCNMDVPIFLDTNKRIEPLLHSISGHRGSRKDGQAANHQIEFSGDVIYFLSFFTLVT